MNSPSKNEKWGRIAIPAPNTHTVRFFFSGIENPVPTPKPKIAATAWLPFSSPQAFPAESQPHRCIDSRAAKGRERAMSLAAATAAGARASLVLSSSSSCRPILLALPCHRRPYRSLSSPVVSRWSRGWRRLQVRAARTESTGVAVGFRAPQFEVDLLLISCEGFDQDSGFMLVSCSLWFLVRVRAAPGAIDGEGLDVG